MNVFLLLFLIKLYLAYGPICKISDDQIFPINLHTIKNSTFVNINLSTLPSSKQGQFSFVQSLNSLSFIGDFGNIILDGNSDFYLGEIEIKYIYNCSNLTLTSSSINLYWGGKEVQFELFISCSLYSKVDQQGKLDLKKNIIISVPIESVGVDTIEDNPLLESIDKQGFDFENGNLPFQFQLTNFGFDKYIFNIDDLNQETLLYFYNGNNPIDCDMKENITYFFLNDFIKISKKLTGKYNTLFERTNVRFNITYYFLAQEELNALTPIVINRNFYYNERFIEFEELMLSFQNQGYININFSYIASLLLIILFN